MFSFVIKKERIKQLSYCLALFHGNIKKEFKVSYNAKENIKITQLW